MAANSQFNIQNIIAKLLSLKGTNPGKYAELTENEISTLCIESIKIFLNQPILLELEPRLKICGSISGQFFDLLDFFDYCGYPNESNYLFLGNYVDSDRYSIETICLLLAYKIKYPEKFFLIRGRNETEFNCRSNGFMNECTRRYSIKLFEKFIFCFNCLPIAALIGDKIFCCHSGLSPRLSSFDQIRNISRPIDVSEKDLIYDLLFSSPKIETEKWDVDECGYLTFGKAVLDQFLKENDLDLMCRSSEYVENGFEFFSDKKLLTLFSAPNYCGRFKNSAAIMSVDDSLKCSLKILRPID